MIPALRAEARKLLTIRSTYIITGIALLLTGFISLYGMGYKGSQFGVPDLGMRILNMVSVVQIFTAIVAMLLITHEYRYNTITYTLTISNSRLKVLLAKVGVVTIYSASVALITAILSGVCIAIGVKLAGHNMGPQQLAIWDLTWRSLVFVCSGTLAGLVFGFLSRSIVFAIVAFFIIPTTVEPLLHNLLKVNNNYLPFMMQSQVVSPGGIGSLSSLQSAGVFMAYLLGAWIIATILFVRRDAN